MPLNKNVRGDDVVAAALRRRRRYSAHDVQDVEQLALVLVDALDLRVEQMRRIELEPLMARADAARAAPCCARLTARQRALNAGVVGERHERFEPSEIGLPARRRCAR